MVPQVFQIGKIGGLQCPIRVGGAGIEVAESDDARPHCRIQIGNLSSKFHGRLIFRSCESAFARPGFDSLKTVTDQFVDGAISC